MLQGLRITSRMRIHRYVDMVLPRAGLAAISFRNLVAKFHSFFNNTPMHMTQLLIKTVLIVAVRVKCADLIQTGCNAHCLQQLSHSSHKSVQQTSTRNTVYNLF